MKATKIIGAVLGVLLVAALFTGAAAAAGNNLGTVFYYEKFNSAYYTNGAAMVNDWYNLDGQKLTIEDDAVIDDTSLVPGAYYAAGNKDSDYVVLAYADATVKGFLVDALNEEISTFIDGVVGTEKSIKFDWVPNVTFEDDTPNLVDRLVFTNPDGTLVHNKFLGKNEDGSGHEVIDDSVFDLSKSVDSGLWTVQAHFDKDNFFGPYVPDSYLYGSEYYFTVAKTSLATSVSATEVIKGNYVTIKLEGVPGDLYAINVDAKYFKIADGCPTEPEEDPVIAGCIVVKIGSDGTVSLDLEALDKGTANVKIYKVKEGQKGDLKKEVEIVIKDGSITIEASSDSIYLGNKVTFSGHNDNSGNVYLWIKGTNLPITELIPATSDEQISADGKEWEEEDIVLGNIKVDGKVVSLDAGTYTIYAATKCEIEDVSIAPTDDNYDGDYATTSIALKQPFITITKAPEVVVQGDDIEVIGTAEGKPDDVQYYVFGTNFFKFDKESVANGKFTISIETSDKENDPKYAATGQYFIVIQHPMYDKNFNIGAAHIEMNGDDEELVPDDDDLYKVGDVILNKNAQWNDMEKGAMTVLFNVKDRQTANAAQALCDALDSQDIDDMYVKASFIVAIPTSYVDPVPSQITKGQVLTVSGTTTGHSGDIVLVELLSTAFAAVPKETVGSAAFTSLSTKIGDDGVWSVSFDTSSLNADEYTCSVAVGTLGATTSKVTIVEGAGPQPTQTTPVNPTAQPTAQPTATPATPGFGALAALAGLGAVAVLLLRRQ